MFQQMLNASRAVLLRPSVAAFEEHERDDLKWALIYTLIAAVAAAILRAIGGLLQRAALEQQMADLQQRLGNSPILPIMRTLIGGGLVFSLVGTLIFTIIFFFFFVGILYLLGRAFGGTGTFGELAYDIALYSAPITVLASLFGIVPIVGGLVALLLSIYEIYLNWLSVQAGMNLPGSKALWVILIPLLVILLLCCGIFTIALLALLGASRS
jgi:hypothetical protein